MCDCIHNRCSSLGTGLGLDAIHGNHVWTVSSTSALAAAVHVLRPSVDASWWLEGVRTVVGWVFLVIQTCSLQSISAHVALRSVLHFTENGVRVLADSTDELVRALALELAHQHSNFFALLDCLDHFLAICTLGYRVLDPIVFRFVPRSTLVVPPGPWAVQAAELSHAFVGI